jgi:serine/threonine protein kinase
MFCPYCGTSAYKKRFCTRCGAILSQTRASATPAVSDGIKESSVQIHSSQKTGALTGLTLDQKYRLEDLLGAGGTGTVYRARRLFIGDTAAVKILHPDQTAHPNAFERFRREAQIAARLKHENVVYVYDFGVSRDGLVYFVMEFVEGESLRKMIERQGKLDEAAAAEIMRQVCAAMNDAHEQGVVHRDLKPDNILVHTTPRGLQVKVLDFGISARREASDRKLTRSGGVIGTPHYMSPEQCKGAAMDGRSDIYSLGVVLFEMLTGVLPFNSTTPTAIVAQHVNQAAPPLRRINPEISPAVEAVVLRALAKQPEARPQTAGDLARELTEAVKSKNRALSIPAHPTFDRKSAKAGSNRKPALLFIAALLLLTAGGGFWRYWPKSVSGRLSAGSQIVSDPQHSSKLSVPSATPDPIAQDSGSTTPSTPVTPQPLTASADLWEVIPDQTRDTIDAAFALGSADQQMASIKPGGQLALNYREGRFFGEGQGSDLRVHGPDHKQVSYTIFVTDDPDSGWRRIDTNRKGFPQGMIGHDMGHHGVRQARQVMIKNNGNTDLNIDAATAVYKDKVSGERHQSKTPLKAFTAVSVAASKQLRSASDRGRRASHSLCLQKRRNPKA